ncbi:MAG: hypothetical protein ABSA67_02615 [Candidatus Brocadiia bacterium]|jgi:hypothetical protein
MADKPKEEEGGKHECPFCAFWAAAKDSEAAGHARGIERESLLLVRSLLTSCISALEGRQSGKSGS